MLDFFLNLLTSNISAGMSLVMKLFGLYKSVLLPDSMSFCAGDVVFADDVGVLIKKLPVVLEFDWRESSLKLGEIKFGSIRKLITSFVGARYVCFFLIFIKLF